MANESPSTAPAAAPSKAKGGFLWLIVAAFALAAGASVPWLLGGHGRDAQTHKKVDIPKSKQAAISFDNVVVNIGDEHLNRYLRVKFVIAVEEFDAREVGELVNKQKAYLKNWVISYLADQSIPDVLRKVGVNRIRREIRDQFNLMLYPDGDEKIVDIFFDEFHLQ